MERTTNVYLLFFLAVSLLMGCVVVNPADGEAENVTTACNVFVDEIDEGQPVTVSVQIYPAPPEGEVFTGLCVIITSPMQGVWGNGGNGPWAKGDITTDQDGKATVTFDIVTFGGYWNAELSFSGQQFENDTITYLPCSKQIIFHVIPSQTPPPTETNLSTLSPVETPTPSPIPSATPAQTSSSQGFDFLLPLALVFIFVFAAVLAMVLRRKQRCIEC
jgi:hypothetical protein